jgi:hypothetical protein
MIVALGVAACNGGGAGESATDSGSGSGSGSDSDSDSEGGSDSDGETGGPVCTDCTPGGAMTHGLPSPAGATVWTTTTMDKVLREATPPSEGGDAIAIFAAKNEFEPFQVVVHPDADADVSVSLGALSGPGTIAGHTVHRVDYVTISAPSDPAAIVSGQIPDPLTPIASGAAQAVQGDANQPFWITVHVPADAPAGDYTGELTVTVGGASEVVPVRLHVYDFALPAEISFDGNWNSSFQALGGGDSLERVELLKDWFFDHRLVPSSVAWPAGLNYDGGITYDCAGGFVSEANPYDFSELGPKYIDGAGWNGVGFPSFQIMDFVNNSTPRPQEFCGVDRGGDHFGTAEYNAAWSQLLAAIDAYLVDRGWEDVGYYYVQNEPQNQADYDVAAFLADLTKEAAPNLRIAVSEEPKPEIAEHADIGGGYYDLWWADLSHFEPGYAAERQALGEEVWWYFLYGDLPPHFNPITIDHAGIETRIAHWAAWKHRIRGFAYYSVTGWGSDPYGDPRPQGTNQNGDGFLIYPPTADGELVTSIRWELLREGVEDFEYLRLAAGGMLPTTPSDASGCDASVDSAVSSVTAFTRDASALKHLRDELGFYLEGQRDGCPLLDSELPGVHERAAYYINFQDPAGEPSADPLSVDGHDWLKIGWDAYDADKGYGWAGPYIGDAGIMLYQYLGSAAASELERSVIYNDYGRTDTFNWDIEGGLYEVTVGIGWDGKSYGKQRVIVEGQALYDDAATTPETPYLSASVQVEVSDGNLTVEVGQMDEYTMLNYMSVVPVD